MNVEQILINFQHQPPRPQTNKRKPEEIKVKPPPKPNKILKNPIPHNFYLFLFIYLFGVLRRFQRCTGHITTGSWKGRGNQYMEFVRVLYCKLPTNGKQLPAFPLEAVTGIEPRPQRWEARVLPLCHRGPPTPHKKKDSNPQPPKNKFVDSNPRPPPPPPPKQRCGLKPSTPPPPPPKKKL